MTPDEHRGRPMSPTTGFDDDAEEKPLSWAQIEHLVHAPLRRPLLVVLPWIGVIVLAIAALFVLPKRYRSTTLILIESEKMPDSFVARVATQDTSRRIENIKPEILSRTRLERVLAETDPYPDLKSKTRAVDVMREAITVNQSGSDGFTIEFVHQDPRKAQQVTERLATLFIGETVKARERQVGDAVDFLVTQVSGARSELEKKDEALRRYKESRMGRLPEQLNANLATMQMLQRELQAVEESLYLAREKQDALARGGSRPSLSPSTGRGLPNVSGLDELRNQLAALRSRYTDEHPDVQSLRSRIARAEAALTREPAPPAQGVPDTADAITRDQLKRVEQDVQKLEERRGDVERRIADIRERVEATPRTEQELANLTRDYNKLSDNYTALLAKQMEAQMAGRLEQRWKGDQFRMLDPAHLPEKPDSPKPVRILAIGVVLGFLLGLGASVVAEVLDPTLKDAEQLQTLLPFPVLARIPHLPSLDGPAAR